MNSLTRIRSHLWGFLLDQHQGILMLRRQQQYIAYLGQPYSHPDPKMRQVRYDMAMIATTWLLANGIAVYSPIVHCHPLSSIGLKPKAVVGHDYTRGSDQHIWEKLNRAHITRSAEFIILELAGWQDSVGLMGNDEVEGEVAYAESISIPVTRLPAIYPHDLDDLE